MLYESIKYQYKPTYFLLAPYGPQVTFVAVTHSEGLHKPEMTTNQYKPPYFLLAPYGLHIGANGLHIGAKEQQASKQANQPSPASQRANKPGSKAEILYLLAGKYSFVVLVTFVAVTRLEGLDKPEMTINTYKPTYFLLAPHGLHIDAKELCPPHSAP